MQLYLKEQYFLNIVIGGQSDFLTQEDDFIHLVLLEEAGNTLPTFNLSFKVYKEKEDIFKYLNEGNIVSIQLGKDPNTTVSSEYVITKCTFSRSGEQMWTVQIYGIQNAMSYLAESKIWASDRISGVECILEKAEEHFKVESNIKSSSDKQYWVQPNVTDKKFISDVWMHSYRPDSFIGIGISTGGKFILKDMLVGTGAKWKFGHKPPSEWIKYHSDYIVDIRSGLMNYWAGFNRVRPVWDADEDAEVDISESFKPALAQTRYFNRRDDVGDRSLEFRQINDNVDPNYWNAHKRNMTSLALFSSVELGVEYADCFRPMRVLDRVFFLDSRAGSNTSEIVYHTGYYFISHITRRVDYKNCNTLVVLNRESLSEIKGDLV